MPKSKYQPPFTLTSEIVSLVADIAEQMGRLGTQSEFDVNLRLRRVNRIRTITGSLAIEGNTLTEQQITAILEGKPVLAPPRELKEARNALKAYEHLQRWDGMNETDLLAAHRVLMHGLLDHPGMYRAGGVGVMAGNKVLHMAPPASRVRLLMSRLFEWLRNSQEHPLISSSVFHYEFEFIHPFADGNGRMGRLWQTLLLSQWQPAFAWLPVESLVHQQQAAYYQAIDDSTAAADCASFIRFMLGCVHEAVSKTRMSVETPVETPVEKSPRTPQQILALLRRQPELTLAEVAQAIGRSLRTVERAAAKLQQENQLHYRGPKKGGHWEVSG
jgi:Fic family protein